MIEWGKRHFNLLILIAGLISSVIIFLPGLNGPWLIDDDYNLGILNHYQAGQAPYHDIIFNNGSGPLGRSVSMATFAANHALGLFSDFSLKATNLFIHLCNGLLVYVLFSRLFQLRNPAPSLSPLVLSALITAWWLLLPIHIGTVLYIVQRMTQVASFFSLASCLCYVIGRQTLQKGHTVKGLSIILVSLLGLLPLAVLAKESAFSTVAWLVLIDLFFFSTRPVWRIGIKQVLVGLIALVIVSAAILVMTLNIGEAYKWRDFSLAERLLTQSRVIWSYIGGIFLPNNSSMGIFQDDYPVSHGLLAPPTTAAALLLLSGLLLLTVRLADSRWWGFSLGVLLYFSGHLIESTIISLELYFEHRNYLPSIGLLIAASSLIVNAWRWPRHLLAVFFLLYFGLIGISTLQRTHIWGNKSALLEISALNHPHSLRAWTDYTEDLLSQSGSRAALGAAQTGAQNNPDLAGIFHLQAISIYCRADQPPPSSLIQQTANALIASTNDSVSVLTPLQIGLDYTLTQKQQGHCRDANFSALGPALIRQDQKVKTRFGTDRKALWFLRLTIAEWLLSTGQEQQALGILRDSWAQSNKSDMPMVGLVLAQTLHHQQQVSTELQQVLTELTALTGDAPPDFQAELNALRPPASGSP